MEKYRVWAAFNEIKKDQFDRETEKYLFDSEGRKHAKRSNWYNYFDTWGQAKQFLIDSAEEKVIAARRELERANGLLGNAKGMKPPADEDAK